MSEPWVPIHDAQTEKVNVWSARGRYPLWLCTSPDDGGEFARFDTFAEAIAFADDYARSRVDG